VKHDSIVFSHAGSDMRQSFVLASTPFASATNPHRTSPSHTSAAIRSNAASTPRSSVSA